MVSKKWIYWWIFFMSASYALIGWYLIHKNNITIDEFLHFGAAALYADGLGGNNEHPFLHKVVISFFLQGRVDPGLLMQEDAYGTAYHIITVMGLQLFQASRGIILALNSLPVIYLMCLALSDQLVRARSVLVALVSIIVFSPSFFSHNYLITFDVGAALYALAAVVSSLVFLHTLMEKHRFDLFQFLLLVVWTTAAINIKFSNMILVPYFVLFAAVVVYVILKKKGADMKRNLAQCAAAFALFGVVAVSCTALLSERAFGNTSVDSRDGILLYHKIDNSQFVATDATLSRNLPEPIYGVARGLLVYYRGVRMTLARSHDAQTVLIDGTFGYATFTVFAAKAFWLKESTGFIVMLLLSIGSAVWIIARRGRIQIIFSRPLVIFGGLFIAYPLAYLILGSNSALNIGYRHFYPILIFVYVFAAYCLVVATHKQVKWYAAALIAVVLTGALALSSNMAYINIFARDTIMKFNDSTYNWGQQNYNIMSQAIDDGRVTEKNASSWAHFVFLNGDFNYKMRMFYPAKTSLFDQMSANNSQYHLDTVLLPDTPIRYLMIDSDELQRLYGIVRQDTNNADTKKQINITQKNLDILKKSPILYQVSGLVYVYAIIP
jgi:hypothetical protein